MNQTAVKDEEWEQRFILKDNLWKIMVQLSWPAIAAMVLYGLNAIISALFVARYIGETALAGVSLVYPLTQISMGLGSLIGIGAGAVLSIAIGRGDKALQERLLGHVNALSLIITAIYMVVALPLTTVFVKLMGGQGEALIIGERYFFITVLGSFFWIYGLAANMIVRAEGKMKTGALIMGIGLAVDIGLHYLLVASLNLGVEGAAWATNAGMIVYTFIGWLYFGRGWSSFKTKVNAFYWDKATIKSVLSLGMSSLIMNVMNLVQGIVVFNALSRYGTVQDIAFYGVVYRLFTFLLTPIFGLMRALQPVVGINYGAGQYDRVIGAYKVFTAASMLLTLPCWLISMAAPGSVLELMMPGAALTGEQMNLFRVYMAILPLLSIIFMAMTFFPSIDKGKPAAMIGIVRQLLFYIPVMLFAPAVMGVAGVYWGALAIDTLIVVWTILLIYRECIVLRKKSTLQPGQVFPL